MIRSNQLLELMKDVADLRIVCVGDIMLDRFIYGSVARVSPEAPIPVLSFERKLEMPGAVGNVARNVAALGASVSLIGVVGDDPEGHRLTELIAAETAIAGDLISVRGRRTTMKSRYVASGQQLLRVDKEDDNEISGDHEADFCQAINEEAVGASAILLSDYAKGAVTAAIIDACIQASKAHGIPLIVDPKSSNLARYGEATVVKPNLSEFEAAMGARFPDDEALETGMRQANQSLPASSLVVTRSSRGLSCIGKDAAPAHFRARPREVFDVSGAGDTSLAALGLAIAAGWSLEQAAEFALLASGIAVTKAGTAVVSFSEILAESGVRFADNASEAPPLSYASRSDRIDAWHEDGLVVGFTNGCFDLLHPGHLSVLEYARAHCDRLVVGINSDNSVRRLKGPSRPINNAVDRARLLAGLAVVDEVIVFEEDTPARLISEVRPMVLVKGGDYSEDTIVGAAQVREAGGRVLIAPLLEGHSSTAMIGRSGGNT